MPLYAWSGTLAGLAYAGLALRLWQLGYGAHALRQRAYTRLALWAAVLLSALWAWTSVALALHATPALAWLLALAELGRYAAWLVFLLSGLQAAQTRDAPRSLGWMVPSVAGLLALAALLLLQRALPWQTPLDAYNPGLWVRLALPVLALVLLEQVFRNARDDALWSIKPLCLGLLATFAFDLYLDAQAVLLHQTDADALAIRGLVQAAVVPLLALSVERRQDWASGLRLSPKAAFHSVTLLAVGLYLLFLSSVGYYVRYFGGTWGRALQQVLVFVGLLAMLVLLFSGSARARLRVALGKHFFHYRFDYREEWLRFTRTLSNADPAQDMGQRIVRALADMLESPAGALWTRSAEGQPFRQTAQWNQAPAVVEEDSQSPLCCFLAERGWVIDMAELRSQPARYGMLRPPLWLLQRSQAWLLIPLRIEQQLIGFCVLDNARSPMAVDWEVNDLLKTAGQQAASYLAQAQATEALLEARKFEAFNRMSAFVAHDLKNIITQLALMLKNAQRLGHNPAFQHDMLLTIENALERMRQLLQQLRQDASAREHGGSSTDLQPMLQRIAEHCSRTRGQALELHSSGPLPVRGQGERLERVLGHLVHNALDATAQGGRVWARLERCGRLAQVRIGDTGHGMSASFVQNRLFKPFQSTKPSGMGIGAFESLLYVQELGGSIQVQSAEGQGTLVTLQLPLAEALAPSGLATVGAP